MNSDLKRMIENALDNAAGCINETDQRRMQYARVKSICCVAVALSEVADAIRENGRSNIIPPADARKTGV